jgi:glycosyltransferase involved in cell wall biosynthesis
MNILMLFSSSIPVHDGIGSHVLELSKRLRDRGHSITLMPRGDHRNTREFEFEGFQVIKIPYVRLYPFNALLHRSRILKALKNIDPLPDLIHLHSPLVPSLFGIWPTVVTFHCTMLTATTNLENVGLKPFLMSLMGKTIGYWAEKNLLDKSNAVIAVSHSVGNELKQYYAMNDPKLFTILNSIDTAFFNPGAGGRNEKSLLFVGRLVYGKGLFDLVQSATRVVQNFPEIKYTVIGDGPLAEPLKELTDKLGIKNNITFEGVVHDRNRILQYFQKAYAVLIPSYYEGLSMTMLEAMASGKAIITTNANFTKGILNNEANSLLVNPKSPEKLAEATVKLLSSEELCKKLGENARKTVEDMDSEKQTDKVLEVYRYAREHFDTTSIT